MLYLVEREELHSEELGHYTSYGIRAFCKGKCVAFVSDVSVDEIFVTDLARRFTEGQLSIVHLMDAIEDLLP